MRQQALSCLHLSARLPCLEHSRGEVDRHRSIKHLLKACESMCRNTRQLQYLSTFWLAAARCFSLNGPRFSRMSGTYLYCSTWYDGAALACVACACTIVSCEQLTLNIIGEFARPHTPCTSSGQGACWTWKYRHFNALCITGAGTNYQ